MLVVVGQIMKTIQHIPLHLAVMVVLVVEETVLLQLLEMALITVVVAVLLGMVDGIIQILNLQAPAVLVLQLFDIAFNE